MRLIWNLPILLRKTWGLLKEPGVSPNRKLLLILLSLAYLFWPLDLIPDLPFVGQIDDLGVLFLLMNWFVQKSSRRERNPDAIEAEYYYVDEKQHNTKDNPDSKEK